VLKPLLPRRREHARACKKASWQERKKRQDKRKEGEERRGKKARQRSDVT
jgi:hypothetical protein